MYTLTHRGNEEIRQDRDQIHAEANAAYVDARALYAYFGCGKLRR